VGVNFPEDWGESAEGVGEGASLVGGFVVPDSLVGCEARNRRVGRSKEGLIGRDRLGVHRYLVE
jgi:hypothetical protein